MAKKTTKTTKKTASGVNKSQAIRDYLAKNPQSSPKTIVEDLKDQGVEVSLGLASAVKYGSGKKTARKKKAGRRGRPASRSTVGSLTMEQLLVTRELADRLGGTDHVRQALEVLEKLR